MKEENNNYQQIDTNNQQINTKRDNNDFEVITLSPLELQKRNEEEVKSFFDDYGRPKKKLDNYGFERLCCMISENRAPKNLDLSGLNLMGQETVKFRFFTVDKDKKYLNDTYTRIDDLVDAFKTNTTITHLNLSINGIDGKGAEKISELIERNQHIVALDVSNNMLRVSGTKAIVDGLKKNAHIQELSLRECGIGYLDLKPNDKPQTKELDGGSEAVEYLSNFLETSKHLKKLDLGVNETGCSIGSICKSLEKNNSLVSLDLTGNSACTDISGATFISNLLKTNKHIETLILTNNDIGDTHASKIFESLKDNTSLKELSFGLFCDDISDKSVKTLLKVLETNKSLTEVNISSKNINKELHKELKKTLKNNESIQKDIQEKKVKYINQHIMNNNDYKIWRDREENKNQNTNEVDKKTEEKRKFFNKTSSFMITNNNGKNFVDKYQLSKENNNEISK